MVIPYEGKNLLAFNNSTTRSCGTGKFLVIIEKGDDERIVNMCFLVIPCRSVYNCIIERSFLKTLDGVASTIQLK